MRCWTPDYPAIHAVGRAAVPARAPRMIEISWGEAGHPLVALVGKGVVFDTGGLDLKPSAGMRLMKKDMGGAAHALALARMVMAARLPVRLVVLLPVVENAVAGDAMRPGDVLASRKGLSIEVGNTDAEGRLILADALARAAELAPELTLDFATLTGAARAALGPEVMPFYTDDDALAGELAAARRGGGRPALAHAALGRLRAVARQRHRRHQERSGRLGPGRLGHRGAVPQAIRAAGGAWAHFDIFAWNPRNRRAARRRRGAGDPRRLCGAEGPLRLD